MNPLLSFARWAASRPPLICVAAWLLVCTALPVRAEMRALLVGVSGYAERPLKGPRNDVRRMREVLEQRNFKPSLITTLADGCPARASPRAQPSWTRSTNWLPLRPRATRCSCTSQGTAASSRRTATRRRAARSRTACTRRSFHWTLAAGMAARVPCATPSSTTNFATRSIGYWRAARSYGRFRRLPLGIPGARRAR